MQNQIQNQKTPQTFFDHSHAAEYDKRFAKLAPLREALHLLISAVFPDLPEEARSAGTASAAF